MNYKFYAFAFLLSASMHTFAITSNAKLDSGTVYFFTKNVLNTCKNSPLNDSGQINYLTHFFQLYSQDIVKNGYIPGHSYYSDKVDKYLKDYNCDANNIIQLKKLINHDLLPAHQIEMNKIKNEIYLFRKKNLSASFQVAKYLSYKKNNFLTDFDLDPDIEKLALSLKPNAEIRKKTCSDVMNLKKPLSLEKPKNQDTVGWCYAFTASDLVANTLGINPSAVDIALLTNNTFWQKVFGQKQNGSIEVALNEMIDKGICLEEDIPSSDYHFSKSGHDLNQAFNQVLELSEKYNKEKLQSGTILNELCAQDQILLEDLQKIFPKLNMRELGTILIAGSSNNAFKRIADKSCKRSRGDDLATLKVKNVSGQKEIFLTIDDQLTNGNILGISYNSDVLKNYESDKFIANHVSSIVGRRFNPKTSTCEYLLRNSWGNDCTNYSQDYECHNGHVWIGEDFFKYNNAIKKVTYVQKK